MGRPPIGKTAMTGAERVQRHRLKHAKIAPVGEADDAKHREMADALYHERMEHLATRRQLAEALGRLKRLEAAKPNQPKPARIVSDSELAQKLIAARRDNAVLRRRLRDVADASEGTVFMSRAQRNTIIKALHPDHIQDRALKQRYDDAAKAFNALPIHIVSDKLDD
jgi:hypothetical protein